VTLRPDSQRRERSWRDQAPGAVGLTVRAGRSRRRPAVIISFPGTHLRRLLAVASRWPPSRCAG